MSSYSPSYNAQAAKTFDEDMAPLSKDDLRAVISNMRTWAGITWSIWAHEAGPRAHNLRCVIHYDIATLVTQSLMETTANIDRGEEPSKSLKLPWPGPNFNMKEAIRLALLGNPYSVSIFWLYVNGRVMMDQRNSEGVKVTIFTRYSQAGG